MPDSSDILQDDAAAQSDELLRVAHEAAASIPAGSPGECIYCGEESPRLVNEVCAPCRDEFGLD